MPSGVFTNDWVNQSAKILFRGAPAPDVNKFYVGIASVANLGRTNTIQDFVSSEMLVANGYNRQQLFFSGDGSYSQSNQRHEMPAANVTFNADSGGSSWQFQTVFLIANSHAVANKSFANSNVDASNDRITINSHPWVSGDRLIFTADDLGTLPGGITSGTLYQVLNPTTNNFQIGLSGSNTPINLTSVGSGTFRARSANGTIITYAVETNPITILPGQAYSYSLPIVLLNSGYTSGV